MGVALSISRIIIAYTLASLPHLLHYIFPASNNKTLVERRTPETRHDMMEAEGCSESFNSSTFDALEWRMPILNNVMEALADVDTHTVGVYGLSDEIKDTLFQRVCRRIYRDGLFDVVLIATVRTTRPDAMKIQNDIARQLGFAFTEKSSSKRADELTQRLKNERKVLIILCDVFKGFDLKKVGIPIGAHHRGCKILVSSFNEEALYNYLHAQKIFMV